MNSEFLDTINPTRAPHRLYLLEVESIKIAFSENFSSSRIEKCLVSV